MNDVALTWSFRILNNAHDHIFPKENIYKQLSFKQIIFTKIMNSKIFI